MISPGEAGPLWASPRLGDEARLPGQVSLLPPPPPPQPWALTRVLRGQASSNRFTSLPVWAQVLYGNCSGAGGIRFLPSEILTFLKGWERHNMRRNGLKHFWE